MTFFKCEIKEVYIDCVDNNSMQREVMVHVICVSSTGIEKSDNNQVILSAVGARFYDNFLLYMVLIFFYEVLKCFTGYQSA